MPCIGNMIHLYQMKFISSENKTKLKFPKNMYSYYSYHKIDSQISSQFDSNILQLLGIPGRILVPPVLQILRSKLLYFFFHCSTKIIQ